MFAPVLALSLLALPQGRSDQPAVLDLVEVTLTGLRDRELLRRFATDVDDHFHGHDRAHIFADDREQELLRSLGLGLTVLREDLVGFYAQRAEGYAYSGGGSFAGYRTYEEMRVALMHLSVLHPNIVSAPIDIGTSVEGRTIWALRISDTPSSYDPREPVVWFDGLHHAREPISGEAVLRFAEFLAQNYSGDEKVRSVVDDRNLVFIPCVNPDGYEFNRVLAPTGGGMWRKNMSLNEGGSLGVDLNRNYSWEWGDQWPGSSGNPSSHSYRGPQPFSEPESSALRDFAAASAPDLSITCHSYGGTCIIPWGYDSVVTPDDALFRDFAAALAEPLGWNYGTVWEYLYTANGTSVDYLYGTHGSLALAVEIGSDQDGFWPVGPRIGELCSELQPVFLEMARLAGPAPRLAGATWVEVIGDGDEWKEAGETWAIEVALVNDGLRPSHGRLVLHAPAALTGLLSAPVEFQLATQGSLDEVFQLQLADDLPHGEVYRLRVGLEAPGAQDDLQLILVTGQTRILAADDCQLSGVGWEVDSSGTGGFERADPDYVYDPTIAEASQPGTDASYISGGLCWVTGAAGGVDSAANDVDGVTVITSPRFAAQGFEHLELEYRRWSTNVPQTGSVIDAFRVELSSDDGNSWTALESVGHANHWMLARFDLEAFTELTDEMRLRFTVADDPDGGVTEGLLDELVLRTASNAPTLGAWGRTQPGDSPRLFLHAPNRPGLSFSLRRSLGVGSGSSNPLVEGLDYLVGNVALVARGTMDAQGRAEIPLQLAPHLNPIGSRLYLQCTVDELGPQAAYTNLLVIHVD